MQKNRNKDDRRQAESNDQHKRCILETKKETVYNKVYGYRISKRRLRNINNKQQQQDRNRHRKQKRHMQDQSRIKDRQSNDHNQTGQWTYKADQSHSTEKSSDLQQDQERAKDDQSKEKTDLPAKTDDRTDHMYG